ELGCIVGLKGSKWSKIQDAAARDAEFAGSGDSYISIYGSESSLSPQTLLHITCGDLGVVGSSSPVTTTMLERDAQEADKADQTNGMEKERKSYILRLATAQ